MSSDDVVGRRATALESPALAQASPPVTHPTQRTSAESERPVDGEPPATVEADPEAAEREKIQRVRRMLAHPATWTLPPDLAMPALTDLAMPELPPAGDEPVEAVTAEAPAAGELAAGELAGPVAGEPVLGGAPAGPSGDEDSVPVVRGAGEPADGEGAARPVPDRPAREPHPVSAARPRGRRHRLRRQAMALGSVTAMAAAVVLLIWLLPGVTPTPPSDPTAPPASQQPNTVRLALAGIGTAPDASAAVVATEERAGWKLALDIAELPPAADGTYYEGWLAGPDRVVPLGTFHMNEPGQVGLWSGLPLRDFNRVVVTVQQVGGPLDPGEPVLAGDIPPQ
nr:anti-sigma factor [Micromonospora sp. DSM 115978]